jgi:hypothetical protein
MQRAALGGEIVLIFDENHRSRFRIHRLAPSDFALGQAALSGAAIYGPIARGRRAKALAAPPCGGHFAQARSMLHPGVGLYLRRDFSPESAAEFHEFVELRSGIRPPGSASSKV